MKSGRNFNLELSAKLMTHDAFAPCFHQHDSMYSVGYNHDAPPHEVSVLRLPSLTEEHSEPQNLGAKAPLISSAFPPQITFMLLKSITEETLIIRLFLISKAQGNFSIILSFPNEKTISVILH